MDELRRMVFHFFLQPHSRRDRRHWWRLYRRHRETGRVPGERRLHTLHELAEHSSDAQNAGEVCFIAAKTLAENVADIPFALLYLLQEQATNGTQAVQVEMYGLYPNTEACPMVVNIPQSGDCSDLWSMAQVIRTGEPAFIVRLPLAGE